MSPSEDPAASSVPSRKITLIVFEGAQLLDVAGPADVFGEANRFLGRPGYDLAFVSRHGGSVRLSCGLAIDTRRIGHGRVGERETLIISGGGKQGLLSAMNDRKLKSWVRRAAPKAERLACVCTGSFALAEWGLLEGRTVTTHWSVAGELARRYPGVTVDPAPLYIRQGSIWTSGGVTAGIDMCLAMLEADHGRWLAARVAKQLALSRRRVGNQAQYSLELQLQAGRYGELIDWIRSRLREPLDISRLAERAGESQRTFYRRFAEEIGSTPAAYIESMRLAHAKWLLESGLSVKAAARDAGFTSEQHLSRSFKRRIAMSPMEYARAHGVRD